MNNHQVILALAGRKQSAKDTSYGYIHMLRPDAEKFSFAEPLKRLAIDILGLEPWQVYGTDEQKQTLVPHLLWENFPLPAYVRLDGSIFVGVPDSMINICRPAIFTAIDFPYCGDSVPCHPEMQEVMQQQMAKTYAADYVPPDATHQGADLYCKTGPMTARETLQYWGTEIFRRQYVNVWADACIRSIRRSGCGMAVITDTRFPNEVEAVQAAGGKVIRLTRNPYPEDTHASETLLDPENFDHDRFDAIIDNAGMTIPEQNEELYGVLRRWGYVSPKQVARVHA